MRFQMPETMKGKDGKYPDGISVLGTNYEVNEKTGVFEAPEAAKAHVDHLNIKGAHVEEKRVVPIVEATKAAETGKPGEKDPNSGDKGDGTTLEQRIAGGTASEEDVVEYVDSLSYEDLGAKLTALNANVPNKKSERSEALKKALPAAKA